MLKKLNPTKFNSQVTGSQLHECNQLFKYSSQIPVVQIPHLLQSTFNTSDLTKSSACVSWQCYPILRQPLTQASIEGLV